MKDEYKYAYSNFLGGSYRFICGVLYYKHNPPDHNELVLGVYDDTHWLTRYLIVPEIWT
jgi:hypothetical protein